MLGLEFPEINEVVRWVDLFPTFNKIAMIACAATIIGTTIFVLAAARTRSWPPRGSATSPRSSSSSSRV